MRGYGQLTKKYQSITNKIYPLVFVTLLISVWWGISAFEVVPSFLLPSPPTVIEALVDDFSILANHAVVTIGQALLGLALSIVVGVLTASLMDRFEFLYLAVYPVLIVTQTIPTIAIAPLLILWLGFGILPKVLLIFITCFFPITVSTLSGLRSVDPDIISLMKSMGASKMQILIKVKLKAALESFFAGLKLATAYSIIGSVIAEWLGGSRGLGVYMTRVRNAYALDKLFAVIIVISVISLLLMVLVNIIHKKSMPWKNNDS